MYQTNQSTETDFIALARTSLKKFKTFLQTRLIFFSLISPESEVKMQLSFEKLLLI